MADSSPRAMQLRARIQMMQLAGQEPPLPDVLHSARFLLDDGEPAAEGKVGKLEFLANMRALVGAAAQRILAPFGLAQANCPDLKYWVSYYEGKGAGYIEQAIARYAPDTASASSADDYLTLLVKRIEAGLIEHTQTGKPLDPEPMPDEIDRMRPPLSVLGIRQPNVPAIQMKCASASSTDDTPTIDPYALTREEIETNNQLHEERVKTANEYESKLDPQLKIYDRDSRDRANGAVPYPYTMESVKRRTTRKESNENEQTGSGLRNPMTSYTSDLTMLSESDCTTPHARHLAAC